MNSIPRPEYPNPQFEREDWVNLNGEWEFETDRGNSGKARKVFLKDTLDDVITVPFCPESNLSGICNTDFLNSVWYKREVDIKDTDGLVFLNIGACDYLTTVYVNGEEAGCHKGGFASLKFNITDYVKAGKNTIVINAVDKTEHGVQSLGKQSQNYHSSGCNYTRVTGIWQTVWLTYVPKSHIESFRIYPDAQNSTVSINAKVTGEGDFTVKAYYKGKYMGGETVKNCGNNADVMIKLAETHLWEVGIGRLYDLEITYGEDKVKSYFGLRNISLKDNKFYINNKCVFMRTVLDQGYYPDGIYTAPSESDMIRDIEISLDAGFNGARLHHKIFEPRFLFHCDKKGYLVWAEYPNGGCNHSDFKAIPTILREWYEIIERDFNHPAIIGWMPFCETWCGQEDDVVRTIYRTTKELDPTRLCIDISGFYHVETDVFDIHEYENDVDKFVEIMDKFEFDNKVVHWTMHRQKYAGQPGFVSEYGGMFWSNTENAAAWGYGRTPETADEFIERYRGLTERLLRNKKIIGFGYTQLYDIEQERNGLYTYEREPKFDMSVFKAINSQSAAIEEDI